jgi:hypothetical protein
MSSHYFVTVDAGHLRIYVERRAPGQQTPALDQVESMDFPAGVRSYNERDTDQAGRFGSSKHPAAASGAPAAGSTGTAGRSGMSIDERLPMKREEAKRRARDLAVEIEAFLAQHPDATWDFAAGPELNGAVLEQISPQARGRLKRSLVKDLVKQRNGDLRAHFVNGA